MYLVLSLLEKIVYFTKTMQPSVRDMKLLSTDNETFTFQDEGRVWFVFYPIYIF